MSRYQVALFIIGFAASFAVAFAGFVAAGV
jgi:hypothetical protein